MELSEKTITRIMGLVEKGKVVEVSVVGNRVNVRQRPANLTNIEFSPTPLAETRVMLELTARRGGEDPVSIWSGEVEPNTWVSGIISHKGK